MRVSFTMIAVQVCIKYTTHNNDKPLTNEPHRDTDYVSYCIDGESGGGSQYSDYAQNSISHTRSY